MAVSISASDIREDIRQRLDLPSFDTTTHVTATAVLRMITESAQRLSGKLHQAFGDLYFADGYGTITTVASTAQYSLPTNFFRLIRADLSDSSGPVMLDMAGTPEEWARETAGWSAQNPPKYRLFADKIEFFPTPDAVYTVNLRYTTGIFISTINDTFSGQVGWAEWIVLDVCTKIRARQQKDATDLIMQRQIVEQEIMELSKRRDQWGSNRVRDLRTDRLKPRRLPWE